MYNYETHLVECFPCPGLIRDKIMTVVREVDPEGVSRRRQRRLRRRVYQSKVSFAICNAYVPCYDCKSVHRDQISFGMWTGMTS